MTQKRFECYDLIFLDGFIKDTLTNENIVEPIELIDLMNELCDENTHLEKHLDMVREHRDELIVKNKELRFHLEECRNNKLFSRRELEKENNELKKFIGSDKAIKDILPLLHKELREIIEEECETYRKEKNTVAIKVLQDFAESLGI